MWVSKKMSAPPLDAISEKTDRIRLIESAQLSVRAISEFPGTPKAIAEFFEKAYPDRIAFTDRAWKSLEDCQTRCDFLWEILYLISTELYDLIHENSGQAYKEFTDKFCYLDDGHASDRIVKKVFGV